MFHLYIFKLLSLSIKRIQESFPIGLTSKQFLHKKPWPSLFCFPTYAYFYQTIYTKKDEVALWLQDIASDFQSSSSPNLHNAKPPVCYSPTMPSHTSWTNTPHYLYFQGPYWGLCTHSLRIFASWTHYFHILKVSSSPCK